MISLSDLQEKKARIAVVGLGYVGLPLAILLAKKFDVIGFDIDRVKISELERGEDRTNEVGVAGLAGSSLKYTADLENIKTAGFFVVAVPTPVDAYNVPDLTIVEKATESVANVLKRGDIVVYESTVYPGVTEDVCVPILEKISGLKFGEDFTVGYSPERVNPGDKKHTIDTVTKVVSGSDTTTLDVVAGVYGSITTVHRAPSIKVAEAAKVIENTQRDLNIALMNELAIIFHKMNISVYDVLAAAKTKWNFLPFEPGLVGGHCIGVDPYYLTYKAQSLGYHPEVILAGRHMNDAMHAFLAREIVASMVRLGQDVSKSNVVILGMTFKENVPDVRNSKVALLYKELASLGLSPAVYDPHADSEFVKHEYGITMTNKENLPKADTLVVAVAHDDFKAYTPSDLRAFMSRDGALLADVKHIYKKENVEKAGMKYWSL